LAAAQRLDYLLYQALPVIILDAVFYEATRQIDKLGAQEILDWQRVNSARFFSSSKTAAFHSPASNRPSHRFSSWASKTRRA
jgi:hypothetical protein